MLYYSYEDYCEKDIERIWHKHRTAKRPLEAWHADVKQANWQNSNDIKAVYANASFLNENRVVFNMKGNQYRVIVKINYRFQVVYIRFVGTHKAYDKIDAKTV